MVKAAAIVAVVALASVGRGQYQLLDTASDQVARESTTPFMSLECVYWQPMKWELGGDGWWYLQADGPPIEGDDAVHHGPHFPGRIKGTKSYSVRVGTSMEGYQSDTAAVGEPVMADVKRAENSWGFVSAGQGMLPSTMFLWATDNYYTVRGEGWAQGTTVTWIGSFLYVRTTVATTVGSGAGVRRHGKPGEPATVAKSGLGMQTIDVARYAVQQDSYMGGTDGGMSSDLLEDIDNKLGTLVTLAGDRNTLLGSMNEKLGLLVTLSQQLNNLVQGSQQGFGLVTYAQQITAAVQALQNGLTPAANPNELRENVGLIYQSLLDLDERVNEVIRGPTHEGEHLHTVALQMRDVLVEVEEDTTTMIGHLQSIADALTADDTPAGYTPTTMDPLQPGVERYDTTRDSFEEAGLPASKSELPLLNAGALAPIGSMSAPGTTAPVWTFQAPTINIGVGEIGGWEIVADMGPYTTVLMVVRLVWLSTMGLWAVGVVLKELRRQ